MNEDLYHHYADETNYCQECGEEMPGSWSRLLCEDCDPLPTVLLIFPTEELLRQARQPLLANIESYLGEPCSVVSTHRILTKRFQLLLKSGLNERSYKGLVFEAFVFWESLHSFNSDKVRRLWDYLCLSKRRTTTIEASRVVAEAGRVVAESLTE
jgi:hypothetical protein